MRIVKFDSIDLCPQTWDSLCESVYQTRLFLKHCEQNNACRQRYYIAETNGKIDACAVVYSLKVNVLTFSKSELKLPMTIIGIPASVDASGIFGLPEHQNLLLENILKNEKGIILCLNHEIEFSNRKLAQMRTLPALIFKDMPETYVSYLEKLKHSYRRRIKLAQSKFINIKHIETDCSRFTKEHYELYLNIIKRTPTKLEVLSLNFFVNLPNTFKLHSYYAENELVTWHITCKYKLTYSFLFGGINYKLRDIYDAYYNNLIEIVKEAFDVGAHELNFGQTAQISKMRLGAQIFEKKMFLYHHNFLINKLIHLSKKSLTYSFTLQESHIFKS